MQKNKLYNLTTPQKNIWQLEQVNSGEDNSINHIFSILKFNEPLYTDLLVQALNKIIRANDSFRLKFINDCSSIMQYVEDYSYVEIDTISLPSEDISSYINYYKSLEISIENLYSFSIVSTPKSTYVFYKSHHIIADAWGMTQVAEQLKDIYVKLLHNENLDNYEKISYTTLINREKQYLNSGKYDSDLQFWSEYVNSLNPSKLFNNAGFLNKDANRFEQILDNSLIQRISSYCAKNRISEYAFFLAIFSVYFNKILNSESVVFGTPFLNRQKRLGELECTGMYVSTLPLNVEINNCMSFLDLCRNINSTNLSLYKHSMFPYHKIQEIYHEHSNNNVSLYDIGFSYQINKLNTTISNKDSGVSTWIFSGKQNNPLTIHVSSMNSDTVIFYDYLLSCFNLDEIKKMNSIILHLINEVLLEKNNLNDISILTDIDIKQLSLFNNSGHIDTIPSNVIDIFDDIVEKYPNKTAIICDNKTITYYDLNNIINNITKLLLDIGVHSNTPVGLLFDKSIFMIASMFAVLKSGGCYVPILPDEDLARVSYILNDCNPICILTHKNYDNIIDANYKIINLDKFNFEKIENINVNISSNDIAYIIYTSGSTGNPKGTMVMHKNICSLRDSIKNDSILKATDEDISLSLLKYSFDASGIDIYTSLLFGGTLILVKKEDELNPEKVLKIIENYKVTRSFLIPKWIENIAIQDKLLNTDLSNLKILGTGGEVLKPYILDNLLLKYPNLKLLNLYGPTEATMFTTCKVVTSNEVEENYTSIGKPIFGSRLGVINSNLEFLPINFKGELVIYEDDSSILNISNGYLNLPEHNKNKFISLFNPLTNSIVHAYRTGDIAKINNNLEIEFIGRDDDVVKINGGYLVALNEVEKKLQKLLGDRFESYPIAIPYKNTKVIILFLIKRDSSISLSSISKYINNNISFYMKPKKIIELDEFPLNSSGKIDRKKLKAIALDYFSENRNEFVKPCSNTELKLYNYITKLISSDDFSITDDFIDDLGMDSLSLTSIYTYLKNYDISMQDIYNNSNIKDLSYFIDNNCSYNYNPDLTGISDIKILNNVKCFDISSVLITGVTGFLGIHILKDLLINSKVNKIYCIIRNKIDLDCKQRLSHMMDYYFNSNLTLLELINKKVIILNGDISKNHFGLDELVYKNLKKEVTTVINSAANVKHFEKLNKIKKDNVNSVSNIIDFCSNKISLAHISTLSIAGFKNELTKDTIFDENTLYIKQDFNNNPYLITKFEAEKIILQATNNLGLNATIFRLGNIMPRIFDGVFQINPHQNVFILALKAIINSGILPKNFINMNLEFSPVDECSNIILKLIESGSSNSIYHILNNKEISISELLNLFSNLGYNIKLVETNEFMDKVNKFADEYTKEYILSNNLNNYSQTITLNHMKKIKLSWSEIDLNYIQKISEIIENLT